jgi:hypothetical protein
MAGMPRRRPPRGLTALQLEVGRIFYDLPISEGFLVAGDAALAAHRLTERLTRDLRLVRVDRAGPAEPARDALHLEAETQGWVAQVLPDDDGGALLLIEGLGQRLIAALATGRTPRLPATLTVLGPTMAPEELAGQLVVQLSRRADPDQLVDVHALSRRFPTDRLLRLAAETDPQFDPAGLARSLAAVADLSDDVLPAGRDRLPGLRRFARDWSAGLLAR